jgi:peptide/nickel transport system substrate-binding protein
MLAAAVGLDRSGSTACAAERVEMVRNSSYWTRSVAKSERLVLLPIPEPTTRASALLSGQVDLVAPPPDFVPRLSRDSSSRPTSTPLLAALHELP